MSTPLNLTSPRGLGTPSARAALGSALLYLTPVPHSDFGANHWGLVLTAPLPGHPFFTLVRAGYWLWTLLLQTALFFTLRHIQRRTRPAAFITLLLALPPIAIFPLVCGALWIDARLAPAIYRTSDPAPNDRPDLCRIQHAHLLAPPNDRFAALEHSARAWLVPHRTNEPVLLTPAACALSSFALSLPTAAKQDLIAAFAPPPRFDIRWAHLGIRDQLFSRRSHPSTRYAWSPEHRFQFTPATLLFRREYAPADCLLFRLHPPHQTSIAPTPIPRCPVLAVDGDAIATLDQATFSSTDRRAVISDLSGRPQQTIDLSALGPGFLSIQDLSLSRQSLLVQRQTSLLLHTPAPDLTAKGHTHEFAEVSFTGRVLWRTSHSGDPNRARLIAAGNNWLWWQNSLEPEPGCCSVAWNIQGRPGLHRPARGRAIVSASLHPSGSMIALSVTDLFDPGARPDAIYVISTATGAELFRRPLPPHTHSRVQFLGPDQLAHSTLTGSDSDVRLISGFSR